MIASVLSESHGVRASKALARSPVAFPVRKKNRYRTHAPSTSWRKVVYAPQRTRYSNYSPRQPRTKTNALWSAVGMSNFTEWSFCLYSGHAIHTYDVLLT